MKEIKVVKGDFSDIYKFQRKDKNGIIQSKPKKMWITFKINANYKKFVFQKTLENGIEYNPNDGFYRFRLTPNDTNNINVGTYGFDIAVIDENDEKRTLLNNGVLIIEEHYTHKENEV